jgi:flagellar biosynthetic protein FliP
MSVAIHAVLALVLAGSPLPSQETPPSHSSAGTIRFSAAQDILAPETSAELATRSTNELPRTDTHFTAQDAPAEGFSFGSLGRPEALTRNLGSIFLFGAISILPVALLVLTAFVRISVVLMLVRQALGSPQIPGNQVLTALAFLLTALVMAPVASTVYNEGIAPYTQQSKAPAQAWHDGVKPIKKFMGDQIVKSKHQEYLWTFYKHAAGKEVRDEPQTIEDFPLRVVAPAFLISELTTALFMGFAIYLPFLVVDLVVSVVLSAMGLFLLPPTLVALPIKLILFVLADGWILVADMLLRSFVC